MPTKFQIKKQRRTTAIFTFLTMIALCSVFLAIATFFYTNTREEAYENLHVQTKQIKDNLVLQLVSDRENLSTMANFAAKLYSDGQSYDRMFQSFQPIGLIANIGILNADNTFVTKAGKIDLNGKISFQEEKKRGAYISGRMKDLTLDGHEIIRSAVPIRVGGRTVAILYGVIKLSAIGERYVTMAEEMDAQLFVYEKQSGDLVIDSVHDELQNISFLQDRTYHEGYSYEQIMANDKGFSAFVSAYRNESLHLHYSTIDELGWVIAMGRYDSQVFAKTDSIVRFLLLIFTLMLIVVFFYVAWLIVRERRNGAVTACASDVRRILLETASGRNNIEEALNRVRAFAKARSAIFFDMDGMFYHCLAPGAQELMVEEEDRVGFRAELLRYASKLYETEGAVKLLRIKTNAHLLKTNPEFYHFLKQYEISEVSLVTTANSANYITILAAINPKRGRRCRELQGKISACFSIALNNQLHLDRTTLAATTDSLTGALNRVAYKNDLLEIDRREPLDFSCIYIDVNELHICNNKYGHAAGDEMLLYIANTLKEVFYGQKVYRMGGDEFLVFTHEITQDDVNKRITLFQRQLEPRNYHVAIGMSYRSQNTNTEEMVREAEVRMYEEKSLYYQSKEQQRVVPEKDYVQVETGILEIDTMISVMKEKYNGIYRVSLTTDKARRILMPAYLNYNENEEHFSNLFSRYVAESVNPDYHRAMLNFLNYEVLKRQLMEGDVPKITYKKNDGETVVLGVYRLTDEKEAISDTLWVFAKE